MAAGQGSEKSVTSEGESKPESAGVAPPSQPVKPSAEGDTGLGKMLAAAREKRGLSRADVVAETRIPANYLQMIESSDYGLISDQLYLLPFVRRYSAFLGLDSEEVAMRFVREVQRAEGAPPSRMSEPLVLADNKRTHWGRLAAAAAVLIAVVVLYFLASQHRHYQQPQSVAPSSRARSVEPPPMETAPRVAEPLKAPDTSVVPNPSAASSSANGALPAQAVPRKAGAPPAGSGISSTRRSEQPTTERR
jgi:cytoskeleton protein RodZ